MAATATFNREQKANNQNPHGINVKRNIGCTTINYKPTERLNADDSTPIWIADIVHRHSNWNRQWTPRMWTRNIIQSNWTKATTVDLQSKWTLWIACNLFVNETKRKLKLVREKERKRESGVGKKARNPQKWFLLWILNVHSACVIMGSE